MIDSEMKHMRRQYYMLKGGLFFNEHDDFQDFIKLKTFPK